MGGETDKPAIEATDEEVYRQIWGDEPKGRPAKRKARGDPWASSKSRPVPLYAHEPASIKSEATAPGDAMRASEPTGARQHFGLTGPRLALSILVALLLGSLSAFEFASVAASGSMEIPNPSSIGRISLDLLDLTLGVGVGLATLGLAMIVLRSR